MLARAGFSHDLVFPGDAQKAVVKIYELTELESPPLRLPLGKDAVGAIKAKLTDILTNVQEYESWSEDLLREA